jgi:hypothetical protein
VRGEMHDVAIEPGRTTRLEIVVRFDPPQAATVSLSPSPVPATRAVAVRFTGLPARDMPPDVPLFGYDSLDRGGTWITSVRAGEGAELHEQWRDARRVVAFAGPWLASDPVDVADRDTVTFALRPAGVLIVVPEDAMDATGENLRVLPQDGRPPTGYERKVDGAPELMAHVRPGAVLGPFPAGPHRFRVWWGRHRLPDATATVRAGRATPLILRR